MYMGINLLFTRTCLLHEWRSDHIGLTSDLTRHHRRVWLDVVREDKPVQNMCNILSFSSALCRPGYFRTFSTAVMAEQCWHIT